MKKAEFFEKSQKERNYLVDSMRFFAASWVALFHFNETVPYVSNVYRDFCKLGFLGVPVFFVISGFCIQIAERNSKTARTFLIRRLFRIYPPYWVSVLLVVLCALIIKSITGTNSTPLPKSLSNVFSVLLLYTAPLSAVKTINWVYWTLPYEIFFYLIITLVILLKKTIKRGILLILVIFSIVVPFQNVGFLFFFNELPTFMIGYSLYLAIYETDAYGIFLLVFSIVATVFKHAEFQYLSVVAGICIFIFLNKLKPFRKTVFSTFGDYSYSIYLIHVPIGVYLLGYIKNYKFVQLNMAINIGADILILSIIIVISKISYKYIELKSIQIGKKLTGSKAGPLQSSS